MKTGRKIIQNLFSLTFAEILSKGLIFYANAYLARAIMPEGYGVIGVANSIAIYLLLFSNLGFNTLGTREIASDRSLIPKYVNNINTTRFLLSIIVFSVYAIIISQLDKSTEVKVIYLIAAFAIFSNSFLLDWVYLGIERINVLAVRQVLTSLLNLVGIYVFVHNQSDTILAMAVFTGTTFINSIWILVLYIKEFGMVKLELDFLFLKKILKSTMHIAYYIFFVTVLNTISINLLSILAPNEQTGNFDAGIFNAATKIFIFAIIPASIIQQAFFPLLSRSVTIEDRYKALEKYTMLMFLTGSIVSTAIFTFSPYIIETVFGMEYQASSPVLRYLMVASFFVYINISFTLPLLAWKYESLSTYAIIIGTIINLSGNIILIPIMGPDGSGLATALAEISISVALAYFVYRATKRFYLQSLLKFLAFSLGSCVLGYFLWQLGLHAIICGIITIVIYVIFNFIFKTVTITEIKGYFSK